MHQCQRKLQQAVIAFGAATLRLHGHTEQAVNFGFGQTSAVAGAWQCATISLPLLDWTRGIPRDPPAKTTDSLQTLIDRGGAQASDIHQVLAVL
jgi:hypothetical protein